MGCALMGLAGCAQVAEWLMAADCKSATHRVTEVRILPCAPLVCVAVEDCRTGECCGSEPCWQRSYGNCADGAGFVGGMCMADDGAGQVSVADVDPARIFCLSRHTRTDEFAIGL